MLQPSSHVWDCVSRLRHEIARCAASGLKYVRYFSHFARGNVKLPQGFIVAHVGATPALSSHEPPGRATLVGFTQPHASLPSLISSSSSALATGRSLGFSSLFAIGAPASAGCGGCLGISTTPAILPPPALELHADKPNVIDKN